ncbi:MAG: tRNA (cytidine(34)-2'-O)-methyltransferase [Moraxellaceae bacterium]|nr:tRNA (cytidine(34)-2'-O)-methyltransferase [Pseudomonadales bacterium]MCB1673632.1 tRNA (cytidine(34)-2'-O)-methyltransferase [Pseudomonadales bacterium]MCP5174466.1 tRNA (cytidine(34)-2'-O)-methyltransferase [Moraxellaceae bacterium]MCP5177715.1 tRNA (cytidine(34)-2'-O)-methyltransferase [Moraxellaceae bacterium]HQV22456.1 tRNA (cytidine(34)-2'-O)-methyltransferase [Agitococcus sp.]
MVHVVLFRPEIAGNTGNVIRLCANTGAILHLIKPLAFELEDKKLKRAGLDYHEWARVHVHESWADCVAFIQPQRIFAFTTKGMQNSFNVKYQANDVLLFGNETRGLNDEVRAELALLNTQFVKLPMKEGRSLNLSNSVAVAVYEAWRQLDFAIIEQ